VILSFRWYGPQDPIPLAHIRQIPGLKNIVSAIYTVPPGEIWPLADLLELKTEIESNGLKFETVESIPVHEDIKLGKSTRDQLIHNYQESIRNCAQAGIKVICYNFMPVFDWTRTDLAHPLPDGSTTLAYHPSSISQPKNLPGWDTSYSPDHLKSLLAEYQQIDSEVLWKNFAYFLNAIVPVAEAEGIQLALHPDDPPWPIFGLPRIICTQNDLDRAVNIINSPANSITLCSGSLGCNPSNNVPQIAHYFGSKNRIAFAHLRNVKNNPDGSFHESAHLSSEGSLDMAAIVKTLAETGFTGPCRPDHGRAIWNEPQPRPGYGLYDRALGATYINGLWEAHQLNLQIK